MLKMLLITFSLLGMGCSHIKTNSSNERMIGSVNRIDPNQLPAVDWHFQTTTFKNLNYVYTPFFLYDDQKNLVLYTAGGGTAAGNGIRRMTTDLMGTKPMVEKMVIPTGPDAKNYNYFRAGRVAKVGNELYMLTEISGCYEGCDSASMPKTMATYHSTDDGMTWSFIGYVNVDGKRYVSQWMAQTGLVWNPKGSKDLDLVDLTNNRFVTIGENRDMFVSNDGVNFKSVKMNHPFPHDRLVFASLAKTPFGYHMMTCANWSDRYYTVAVRHLFSKDLINWYPIESSTFLKNPDFYKGVHLTYDEASKKLWAISPCGSTKGCSFVAWTDPKDYLDPNAVTPQTDIVPTGEFVFISGRTAMILDHQNSPIGVKYKVRFSDGSYDSGYTKDMFVFPLQSYKRQGCTHIGSETLCVGDAIYVGTNVASIMGYYDNDPSKIKFGLKFANGTVDTGYTRDMLALP